MVRMNVSQTWLRSAHEHHCLGCGETYLCDCRQRPRPWNKRCVRCDKQRRRKSELARRRPQRRRKTVMKLRQYDVSVVVSVAVYADLEGDEAKAAAREAAYDLLRDDLFHSVNDADVEATDKYEEDED